MCGLTGWVAARATGLGEAPLQAMLTTLAHRGPDQSAEHYIQAGPNQAEVALGHCRLSIIDLEGGLQPMADVSQTSGATNWLAYNGEIYNFADLRIELEALGHRFTDDSDTQVLLKAYRAWGRSCVSRFRGMFAFALWDGETQQMLFARDAFGKKPMFFCQAGDTLVFGSEIKALLAFPGMQAGVDRHALFEYFRYRYVPGPATLYDGITKLPPGSTAIWADGKLTIERYYQPPDGRAHRRSKPVANPVDGFLAHLDDAVASRMVADVPFGAFLSGGLDSSAIVALMARHAATPVRTFSVGFAEARYSELPHARQVADHVGAEHHELILSADDLMQHLPKLVRFRDAPIAETADIPIYLLALKAREHVKMVLTGEGSDEILAGYPKHAFERYTSAYQRLPGAIRTAVAPVVDTLPYGFRRIKTAITNLGLADAHDRLPRWFGALSIAERDDLIDRAQFPCARDRRALETEAAPFDTTPDNSRLRRILYFDQTSWLPDNLLERGDRMTMAASIEARMPFLDTDLAAYVSALPDRYRLRATTGKWILRQAMRQILPATILDRPKVGFRVPVNEWFQGPMRDYLHDHLTGSDSHTRHYYNRKRLEQVLAEHTAGRQNHEKLLWSLLNLELWHRHAMPA